MRQRRPGEVSNATLDVYLRQRAEFMPLTDVPDTIRMVVNTESDLEKAADEVLIFLGQVLENIAQEFVSHRIRSFEFSTAPGVQ
jgi:hypothetical protein